MSPTVDGKNDTVKIAETTAEANAAANAAKADDKVTLVTEGTNVSGKDFTNPAVLKIPVDTKDVKNVNQLTLARLNAETGKLEIVGGSYDAKANAVVGYVVEEGSYFVVEKESLTTISMQIGNNGVVLNNETRFGCGTLDFAEQNDGSAEIYCRGIRCKCKLGAGYKDSYHRD